MAVDLRCPNCLDNLGKTTENPVRAWCGTCGTEFYNPDGERDTTDEKENELVRREKQKRSQQQGIRTGRLYRRY